MKPIWGLALMTTMALSASASAEQHASSTPSASRPLGFTFGIGAGWDLPNDLDNINTASVRFRLPNGLTLEPRVELSTTIDRSVFGMVDVENRFTAITVETTARWPLMSRGPVDLLVLGGLGIDYDKTNPDGADNDSTDTVISLIWGLGVEYWFGPRWALSATATNPLFARTSGKNEMLGDDREDTATTFGAVFDPDVVVMVHLFY